MIPLGRKPAPAARYVCLFLFWLGRMERLECPNTWAQHTGRSPKDTSRTKERSRPAIGCHHGKGWIE